MQVRRQDIDPLIDHLHQRAQYKAWITDCKNRLEHTKNAAFRAQLEADRRMLKQRLGLLDKAIASLVAAQDDWRKLVRRLRTVPGVGAVLSSTLIGLLPELGRLSRRTVAALTAIRRNVEIAAFAQRLKGKKKKVIITACMRKLLVILNAIARDGTDWRRRNAIAWEHPFVRSKAPSFRPDQAIRKPPRAGPLKHCGATAKRHRRRA